MHICRSRKSHLLLKAAKSTLTIKLPAIREIRKTETREHRRQEGPKAAVKPAGEKLSKAFELLFISFFFFSGEESLTFPHYAPILFV